MSEKVKVDGSTVRVGETLIVLQGDEGEPLALKNASKSDGYAVFITPSGDEVTLNFLEDSE